MNTIGSRVKLQDFLASSLAVTPVAVALEAVLVMTGQKAYIVSTLEARDDVKNSIDLDYEKIKPLLFSKAPAYGGGRYLYCDQVVVEGTVFSVSEGAPSKYVLRDIKTLELTRRGHVFRVLP